jgi:citrate synthase
MASALRLTGAFRAAAPLRVTAFNGLRCYSTGKTTVSFFHAHNLGIAANSSTCSR